MTRDLVVLVPDADIEQVLIGLIEDRARSLGIGPITRHVLRHPERDPGCASSAAELLRWYVRDFRHALVVFDFHGSGWEHRGGAGELERHVTRGLAERGWEDRAAAIVIEPELEAWVFSASPHVATTLGFADRAAFDRWLVSAGHATPASVKPERPKEAMRGALRENKRPTSAALFGSLARTVSLTGCTDPAFQRLVAVLRAWFPAPSATS